MSGADGAARVRGDVVTRFVVADDDARAIADSRAVLAKHAKSFRFASLFLPSARTDDAAIVYAFCRDVDDAIDEAPSTDEAARQGALLQQELEGVADPRPSVRAFLRTASRIDLDVRFARELVRGVQSDVPTAAGGVRVDRDETLTRYCYRVAGTVGGMMCAVLGVRDARALPFAIDLGIGMQLTNICRDVLEDAGMDRVYLPRTRLPAQHTLVTSLPAVPDDVRAAVRGVVHDLLARAERHYDSADLGMRFIPWRSRLAILVASRVYRAIGRKLLREGGDALRGRTSTTTTEKLVAAGAALLAFFRPAVLGLGPVRTHDRALHAGLAGMPGADA